MITIRNSVTGEVQTVETFDADAHGADWIAIGDLPAGMASGWLIWDGALSEDAASLDVALHARIDREAGACRCRYITDVPGQARTYQRKDAEARAYLAGAPPSSLGFIFLNAESRATGEAVADAATAIVTAADQCAIVEAAIEELRIGAKRAVTAATTIEAKQAAAVVDWDSINP